MNLRKKKQLAAKVLRVGKSRIFFNENNLKEIKEAITKQDIKDLFEQGIISIKLAKGRKKFIKRKNKKGPGSIRKNVRKRKRDYMILTRKLRAHLKEVRNNDKMKNEKYYLLRGQIKNKMFKNKQHFKENIK